jgi:hypothetical protein
MSHGIKKPAIPVPPRANMPRDRFDHAVKETLEVLTGYRDSHVDPLPNDATTAQIIAKINELIRVLM